MDYKIISFDDHLDLGYLPPDFWTRRMSNTRGKRAPHVEEREGGPVWVCDGKVWGGWRGKLKKTGDLKPLGSTVTAFDRGGITDYSERRPAVPELRLADMDRDGVYSHVIYGPAFSIHTDDPELRDECYQVYNDSLRDFCSAAPERLLGVPMLPPFPEAATKELMRLAKIGGTRQANLQIAEANPRLHDARWEPFWKALEETGVILSFHVAVFGTPPSDPAFGKPASVFTSTKAFIEQFLDPFVDLFAWGILERHPKMRLVMAEAGLGWLPWVVQELDHRFERLYEAKEFWDRKGGIPLTIKPSELFKRQIFASFQDDHVAVALLPFFGEDNVLWASDYPHPDSTWPFSQQAIERQMKHLPPPVKKKLLHDNAAKLYQLDF
jgi:uncharacterized protein